MNRQHHFSFVTLLIFITATLLALVFMVAAGYRQVNSRQVNDDNRRATLSYLHTQILAHDHVDGVEIMANGKGVILRENDGQDSYELNIFTDGQSLLEEYLPAGSPIANSEATVIAQDTDLMVTAVNSQLLKIETRQGAMYIALTAAVVE